MKKGSTNKDNTAVWLLWPIHCRFSFERSCSIQVQFVWYGERSAWWSPRYLVGVFSAASFAVRFLKSSCAFVGCEHVVVGCCCCRWWLTFRRKVFGCGGCCGCVAVFA